MIVQIFSDGQNGRSFRPNDTSRINEDTEYIKAYSASYTNNGANHKIVNYDNLGDVEPDQTESILIIGHGDPEKLAGNIEAEDLAKSLKNYIVKAINKNIPIKEIFLFSCNSGVTSYNYEGQKFNFGQDLAKNLSSILDSDALHRPACFYVKALKGMLVTAEQINTFCGVPNVEVITDPTPFSYDQKVMEAIGQSTRDFSALRNNINKCKYYDANTSQYLSYDFLHGEDAIDYKLVAPIANWNYQFDVKDESKQDYYGLSYNELYIQNIAQKTHPRTNETTILVDPSLWSELTEYYSDYVSELDNNYPDKSDEERVYSVKHLPFYFNRKNAINAFNNEQQFHSELGVREELDNKQIIRGIS
jgi:hypothetical protein